jgi:hypothetical protein
MKLLNQGERQQPRRLTTRQCRNDWRESVRGSFDGKDCAKP